MTGKEEDEDFEEKDLDEEESEGGEEESDEEEGSEEKNEDEDEESEDEGSDEEKDGERKLSRSQLKRRQKKEFQRKRELQYQEEIATLRHQVNKMQEFTQEFAGKISERIDARDLNDVDTRINSAAQKYNDAVKYIEQAQEVIKKSFGSGDEELFGTTFANLEKARDIKAQAQAEYNALKSFKDRFQSTKEAPENKDERQQAPAVDDVKLSRLRTDWMSQNSWFQGANSKDRDSRIAMQIDSDLAQEGYKPDTPAFWKELTNRLREELPHRYKSNGSKKPPHQMVGGKETTVVKKDAGEGGIPPEFRKLLNERYGYDKSNPDRKKAVAYYLAEQKASRR